LRFEGTVGRSAEEGPNKKGRKVDVKSWSENKGNIGGNR